MLKKLLVTACAACALGFAPAFAADVILVNDQKPKAEKSSQRKEREKEFTVAKKYLVMPIQNKGKGSKIHLFVNGEEVRRYGLNLAPTDEEADWYAFFTIENYKGKKARVVATTTGEGFALIRQSDTIPGEEDFYTEPYRPQFHFTQKVGWNNDPNGMVYHDGKWHLFFQHNPVALPWGNMTWGHATSPDLVHWEQQPNALFPAVMAKGACFSGGATVDKKNTAGWGENALIAAFTDTGRGEAIAYSTDGGQTFTYYEGNPVVKHRGRDPKVIWYEYDAKDKPLNDEAKKLGGHWVMAVFDVKKGIGGNIAFYTSTDLKEWTEQSHTPGYHECPELFELPVDGNEKDTRWVVFGGNAQYAVGQFDGKTFTPEHKGKHRVHYGPYYASQRFSNPPDGRIIQIGWLRIGAPGPYNQHFSFPHRLTLHKSDQGVRMFAKPVKEIEKLWAETAKADAQKLAAGKPVELPVGTDLLDVRLTVEVGDAKTIELDVPGAPVKYDVGGKKLAGAPLEPVDGKIKMQVLIDRSVREICGNDGQVYVSGKGPAKKVDVEKISVVANGGDAKLIDFQAHEVKSIWK